METDLRQRGGPDASSVEDIAVKGVGGTAPKNLRFSSFIQNILCEDFRAGAAIVDLFVAVKTAKDNLSLLSESRSRVLLRIQNLTEDTGALREQVRVLLENMKNILSRLNDEVHRLKLKEIRNRENEAKMVDERPEKGSTGVRGRGKSTDDCCDSERKSRCLVPGETEAKKIEEERRLEETGGQETVGNFLSVGSPCPKCGKKLWVGPTGGEELTAAVVGLLGNSEAPRWLTSVAGSFRKEEAEAKRREGGVHLTDSAVQLICDICGILAGPQEPEVENSADLEKSDHSSNYLDADSGKLFCWNCGSKLLKEVREKFPACVNGVGRKGEAAGGNSEDDSDSEIESVFEEAFSDPYPMVADLRTKPSVTCMGDLTKVVKEKKSVSTLTATNDAPSSWVSQLTEDIKAKIKSLRSIKAVTAGEQSEKSVASLSSVMELKIIANTPAGVFDVNVKQYKNQKRKSGKAAVPADVAPAPVIFSGLESDGQFWSNESFLFSGCRAENFSDPVSGKNDFEEFLELSMESQQEAGGRVLCMPRKTGTMLTMFKAVESPMFEVLKCEPRHFIQEILPKAEGGAPKGRRNNADNITTLDCTGTKCPHLNHLPQRLVVENSSSDLIVYVQVEVDKEKVKLNLESAEIFVEAEEIKQMTDGEEMKKSDKLSDELMEKEIREMFPEEPRMWATAAGYVVMKSVARVDVCLRQNLSLEIYEIDQRREQRRQHEQKLRPPDLHKALSLIHEIENDVMAVKLSDAILILPHLEWELQSHLRRKMKSLQESDDDFVFSNELLATQSGGIDDDSEERLHKLFGLVSGLEQAVKLSECELRDKACSRIVCLLRALTHSIRELEEDMTLRSLVEAMDIASELNEAVREAEESDADELPGKERLGSVRQKVFEVMEQEAAATEGRVEGDFDRIDCLTKENDEVCMFVEVFLEKTQTRSSELEAVKAELEKLWSDLKKTREPSDEEEGSEDRSLLWTPSENSPFAGEKTLKNTVSGLLSALDSLRFRARKKSDICRSILGLLPKEKKAKSSTSLSRIFPETLTFHSAEEPKEELLEMSKSFKSESVDLSSSIKDFKQIGNNSLYLSWTKPEGALAESVVGYEILVDGKRHQKVRNPKRLQAVLYSVDLSNKTEIQLQAVIDNAPKTLLATVTYQRES